MNRLSVVLLLFGFGILLSLSRFLVIDALIPAYLVTLVLVLLPVILLRVFPRRKKTDENVEIALREAQSTLRARREVKAKIPKSAPRRDSAAAAGGAQRLSCVRSMATLIRKARLRETILEICDCAEMVLETIRRMPHDTPAAVLFCESHMGKLMEALDRCFEMSRMEGYKQAPASIDREEIECFTLFITAFRKQQDTILFEGLACRKNPGTPA